MVENAVERRLSAILAADVVGYSRLMEQDEAGTFERLRSLRKELFETEIEKHKGRIFKLMGDGLLAEFASIVDAVECAAIMQRGIANRNDAVADGQRIDVRIGINLGDVIVEGDDRHGEGVNIAARLQQLADPGGIAVSGTVFNHVKNKLALGFESLGEHHVKNIAEPLAVYRVLTDATGARSQAHRLATNRRWWRPATAALTLFLLATTTAAVWNAYYRGSACAQPPPGKHSIAILPFDDRGGDPKSERLAGGITEDVIATLSRSPDLFVIAGNSTRNYKDGDVDIRQVGCDLGVTHVLSGSIEEVGGKIRFTPQLVEAATRSLVWSASFDRDPEHVFHMQEEVTASIAAKLLGYQGDLPGDERKKLKRKLPTDNLEAYDYYLRAETLGRGMWSETKGEALALYEKAIELDPKFADAYAGYAQIVADIWLFQYDQVMAPPLARKGAYETAGRALALDPDSPRPYFILSALQTADGWHDQAIESARRAMLLQPNNAEAYAALARALTHVGDHAAALAAMETAMRFDPKLSPQFRADLGWVLYHNRQNERALEQLETALAAGVDYLDTLIMAQIALAGC